MEITFSEKSPSLVISSDPILSSEPSLSTDPNPEPILYEDINLSSELKACDFKSGLDDPRSDDDLARKSLSLYDTKAYCRR